MHRVIELSDLDSLDYAVELDERFICGVCDLESKEEVVQRSEDLYLGRLVEVRWQQ